MIFGGSLKLPVWFTDSFFWSLFGRRGEAVHIHVSSHTEISFTGMAHSGVEVEVPSDTKISKPPK